MQATDNSPCTHYKVQVTTSALATKVLSPSPIDPNSDNPFTVEILRGRASSVVVQSADGQQAVKYNFPSTVPGLFDIGSVNVVASPNGGTATILLDAPDSSNVYEYSVDNIAWYSSNIFTGLASGSYTAHVRDGLGCTKTKDFVVSDTGTGTPYFRYSKLNSIRMANRISHGDCANYKNDENTLSCEADVPRPWKQIQPFQTCDIIPSQFWTNYENVLATAIELDGTETNIPVIKRTNHIGLKDMRDARKYDLGGGRTGIYFITGNLYDFDTLLDTGNDYTLNGFLPEWGEVGNFIRIDSAWYLIESRLFNEDLKVDVLVITDNYSGPDTLVQVGSLYNREAYEVYEYDIDFVDFIDKTLQVKLEVTDPNYETITMLSEEIDVKVRHEHTMEIRAKHRENVGGIYFSLGFEAKIRVPIENVEGKLDNESGIAKTDTHVRLTNAELYEGDDYVLSPVTKQMMHKIVALASLSDVKFDGVGVVRRSAPTIEGPLEDTNLYDITLSMLKSESVYNSKINSDAAFAGENIEIPALVNHGDGYIRY